MKKRNINEREVFLEACRKAEIPVLDNPRKKPIETIIITDDRGEKYTIEHSSNKPKLVKLQMVSSDNFKSSLSRAAVQTALRNSRYAAHPLKGSISDEKPIVVLGKSTHKRGKTRFPLSKNLMKQQTED